MVKDMKKTLKLTLEAKLDNLDAATGFVDQCLDELGAGMKYYMQVELVMEELFVNVSKYAYAPGTGDLTIEAEMDTDTKRLQLVLKDRGVPFDPLAKDDPDVSLPAEKRKIGGLGIFFVKNKSDEMHYRYEDGMNIVTVVINCV